MIIQRSFLRGGEYFNAVDDSVTYLSQSTVKGSLIESGTGSVICVSCDSGLYELDRNCALIFP